MLLRILSIFVVMLVLPTAAVAAPDPAAGGHKVRYIGQARTDYYVELLQLALSYPSGQAYQLVPSGLDLPKKRAFDLMNSQQGIDVMFGSATVGRMTSYRAVPFSVLQGLNGYRVALVHQDNASLLSQVHSRQRLAELRAGQFVSWSDSEILRANGLQLDTSADLAGLYGMLQRGRIDYLPLSVVEVRQELEKQGNAALVIDAHLLLYYPTATYFYVARDNEALASALLQGLQQAKADGRFAQLFARYFAADLTRLNLHGRQLIRLHNPLLPPGVSVVPPETLLSTLPRP